METNSVVTQAYRIYRSRLIFLARQNGILHYTADDVVQDATIEVLMLPFKINTISGAYKLLRQHVLWRIGKERRLNSKNMRTLERMSIIEETTEIGRIEPEIVRRYNMLKPIERNTLSMMFNAHLSIPEIAKIEGKNHNTLYERVERAIVKLRGEKWHLHLRRKHKKAA